MWKIWIVMIVLCALGAVPRFAPGLLTLHRAEATQSAEVPAGIENQATRGTNEEASEFWPIVFGHKFKITDSLIAIFTFCLFAATVALWRSTSQLWAVGETQAGFTRDQLKLAQDEFNYIHRPRLTVRREKVWIRPEGNGINLVLINMGHLVASNIVGNFSVRIVPRREVSEMTKNSLPPYDSTIIDVGKLINRPPRNRPTLEGDERTFIFLPADQLTESALESVRLQESFLYFFGHLQFTGPDGVTRDSAFFRFYSPISGTFETGEDLDPDYEHY